MSDENLVAWMRAQLDEACEALAPFAEAASSYDPDEGDGKNVAWAHDFTIGSLRRARAVYEKIEGGGDE